MMFVGGLVVGLLFGFWASCGFITIGQIIEDRRRTLECIAKVRHDDLRCRQLEMIMRNQVEANRGDV